MLNRILGLIAHPWRLSRILKHVLRERRIRAYPLGGFLVARCFCNSQKMSKNHKLLSKNSGIHFWMYILDSYIKFLYQAAIGGAQHGILDQL